MLDMFTLKTLLKSACVLQHFVKTLLQERPHREHARTHTHTHRLSSCDEVSIHRALLPVSHEPAAVAVMLGTRGQEEVLLVNRKPREQERNLRSQKKPSVPQFVML